MSAPTPTFHMATVTSPLEIGATTLPGAAASVDRSTTEAATRSAIEALPGGTAAPAAVRRSHARTAVEARTGAHARPTAEAWTGTTSAWPGTEAASAAKSAASYARPASAEAAATHAGTATAAEAASVTPLNEVHSAAFLELRQHGNCLRARGGHD